MKNNNKKNKKQTKNNTLWVYDAEANNKKMFYMGRSEFGGSGGCFCLKNMASASHT